MSTIDIIVGSKTDLVLADTISEILDSFNIEHDINIISAHRNPKALDDYIKNSVASIFIAIAGMSAHLAGAIAARTVKPVIGVPANVGPLQGFDALLSTVQMPSGIPVATVAINGAKNAAYLALQILALSNESISTKLLEMRE